MYETNQNQGYNLLLQGNLQYLKNSSGVMYFKMDCTKMDQKSQDWLWYTLNQKFNQEIYQTSFNPYQINNQRETRDCIFNHYRPFRSRKTQVITQAGFFSHDYPQIFKTEQFSKKQVNFRRPRYQNGRAMRPNNTKDLGYLQMDTKHVTPELSGLPVTVYEYAAIDILSRYKLAVLLPDIDSECASLALQYFLKWFPFPVKYIQTDNGLEYQREFDDLCKKHNINHYFIHKNSPNENAVIERSFRTDQDEFYSWLETRPEHIGELNQWLQEFINKYNSWRPHRSLEYKTSLEVVKMVQMS